MNNEMIFATGVILSLGIQWIIEKALKIKELLEKEGGEE